MNTVTHLKLRNCCQYAAFDVDIHAGLTAVIGRNGSGKTTLLRALAYALTGWVDGSWGTQANLQKDGSVTPGFAEVEFTDGTGKWAVRRFFTSSVKFPDVVISNGKDIYVGRKKVNAFMDEIFGMPCALMFQVCWGRQGELAYLLKSTPAMVSSFLSMLFDTRSMERLREKIKAQVDTIAALPSDCERQLESARKELEAMPSDEELSGRISAMDAAITLAQTELAELLQPGMTAAERDASVANLTTAIDNLRKQIADAGDTGTPIDAPESASFYWSQFQECDDALKDIHMKMANAESMRAAHERDLHMAEGGLDAVRKSMDTVREALDKSHEECPLCHSAITDSAEYEDAALKYLAPQFTSRADFDARSAEILANGEAEVEKHKQLMQSRVDAIEALKAEENELSQCRDALSIVIKQKGVAGMKADLAKLEDQLSSIQTAPVKDADTEGRRQAVEETLRQFTSDRDALIGMLSANGAKRDMLLRYIADYEKAVRQYHVNRDARQALNDIRDALSQSRAQARYLKSRIETLNAHLRRYTALTAMPFTVRLDNVKRCFVYSSPDGVEHPAAHLSGAQQAMTAVALQMAIFAVANPSMNFYLIDEPTEACDDGNKEVMAQMFARMNSMLEATSGVMLIVARDEQTLDSCQNMIEVTNE